MKIVFSLLPQLLCAYFLFVVNICYANNPGENLFSLDENKVITIRKELRAISTELSDLENIFVYPRYIDNIE